MIITGTCSFTLCFLSYWKGTAVDEFDLIGLGVAIMLDIAFKLWEAISSFKGAR